MVLARPGPVGDHDHRVDVGGNGREQLRKAQFVTNEHSEADPADGERRRVGAGLIVLILVSVSEQPLLAMDSDDLTLWIDGQRSVDRVCRIVFIP